MNEPRKPIRNLICHACGQVVLGRDGRSIFYHQLYDCAKTERTFTA